MRRESLVAFPKRRQCMGISRRRREIAGVDLSVDLLQGFLVLAALGKILFDLLVPGELIAAGNVRS